MYFLLLHFFVLVILNECEESLIRVFLRFFDNAAFSRPALHEHCPCYVRPFAIGINFVEPAFARSEITSKLVSRSLNRSFHLSVLTTPPYRIPQGGTTPRYLRLTAGGIVETSPPTQFSVFKISTSLSPKLSYDDVITFSPGARPSRIS